MGKDFLNLYDNFLSLSSTMLLSDVVKIAEIDLYSKEFWLTGINQIINEIDQFDKMV